MPGSADFVQRAVHALEAGGLAVWVKRALVVDAIIGLALFYLIHEFRGLATSQAMDQAQIGRHFASGDGFKTSFVRPRAVGQLRKAGKDVRRAIWSDTYNAPLPPVIDAIALRMVKSHWKMTPRDIVYAGDKAIAVIAILFFLGSVLILYFTARRLFDHRLALLGCGLVFFCDAFWQYSLSGLPQMFLLCLFNATVYVLVRAVETEYAGGRTYVWLGGAGVGFGFMALSHALTIWMFVPMLIFAALFFRPRGRAALIVLAAFTILYAPWLVRNFAVCGNPGGVAIYSVFDLVNHTEAGHMRRVELDLGGQGPATFGHKVINNFIGQFGRIFEYLGWNSVAPLFFVALLHLFRRPETRVIQWMMLAMWLGAVIGMAVYGMHDEHGVAANQLHLLFVPIMICFGLAFLLVQWNRLSIDIALARTGFLAGLYLVCGVPMLCTILTSSNKSGIHWPPYVPPYISVLNDWMTPQEVVASDMPWAIAWYADRPSLWVPETVKAMADLNDYNVLGLPINGLYLTPVSGSQNTLSDILKGEYKDWATVILRSVDIQKMPLKSATLLGLENECIFFSDHDRQHPSVK